LVARCPLAGRYGRRCAPWPCNPASGSWTGCRCRWVRCGWRREQPRRAGVRRLQLCHARPGGPTGLAYCPSITLTLTASPGCWTRRKERFW